MRVSDLEAALFAAFPRTDAEPWDHVGLSVGDPAAEVGRVFVALDATVEDVRAAHAVGANVLVAHHPVYLDAPDAFTPRASDRPQAAAAVYEAARLGVSVLSFHTNLDRSLAAQEALPRALGMARIASLEHADDPDATGLGSYADAPASTLGALADRVASAFGIEPRVWGDPAAPVARCAFLGGSLGHFGERALECGAHAIVTGEAGYHVCQDLAQRGLGIVLIGHDVSEYPFCALLATACADVGVPTEAIIVSRFRRQWWARLKENHA